MHPRQVKQLADFDGAGWSRWGSFAVYGVKLPLLCSIKRVPISYELSAANAAEVTLVGELLASSALEEQGVARRLFGDLAYRSARLKEGLAEAGVLCWQSSGPTGGLRSAGKWRCASRFSSASSGWVRRWRSRWWGCSRGSRRR